MSPGTSASILLGMALVLSVASLTAMVLVVAGGDRHPLVAVIEVATWTAATVWLPLMAWRRYRSVTRRRSRPDAPRRSTNPTTSPGTDGRR